MLGCFFVAKQALTKQIKNYHQPILKLIALNSAKVAQ